MLVKSRRHTCTFLVYYKSLSVVAVLFLQHLVCRAADLVKVGFHFSDEHQMMLRLSCSASMSAKISCAPKDSTTASYKLIQSFIH